MIMIMMNISKNKIINIVYFFQYINTFLYVDDFGWLYYEKQVEIDAIRAIPPMTLVIPGRKVRKAGSSWWRTVPDR